MIGRVTTLAIAIATLGCSRGDEPSGITGTTALAAARVSVETIGTDFERPAQGGWVSVPFRVTNRSNGSVFLARCGERVMATIDRWGGTGWEIYGSGACQGIHRMDPMRLAAGAARGGATAIGEAGLYRLRIAVAASATEEADWAASNTFRVR